MTGRLNPLTVLGVCLAWIVMTTLAFSLAAQLAAIALFAGLTLASRRVGPLRFLALMAPFALFGLGFFITNVLFRQENASALAVFSHRAGGGGAVEAGLILFLRALSGGAISLYFALTVDAGGFIRALMATLRLPPAIAYALFAALQIVPDLAARVHALRLGAAMRRGRAPRRFPSPREAAALMVPLLAYAIRRAGASAIAMEARGLAPGRPRTLTDVPGFSWRDLAFSAMMAAALLAVAGMALEPRLP